MNKKSLTTRILTMTLCLMLGISATARHLGVWTQYNAYPQLTHVVPAGNIVFALSEGKLYSYNLHDESYTEFNNSTYLNDCSTITDICLNNSSKRLIITYANGNIDLLSIYDNSVRNLSAIADEMSTYSKNILNTFCNGKYAYIVTKWGIVTVNTEKCEITDTYRLDKTNESITDVFIEGETMYVSASSDISLYGASMICGNMRDNLLDKDKWTAVDNARKADITKKMNDRTQSRNIYKPGTTTKNGDMVHDPYNNCFWGSNSDNLLVMYHKDGTNAYTEASTPKKPYGPVSNNFYNIYWKYNKLYTVGQGWIRDLGANVAMPGMVQTMTTDGRWQTYQTPEESVTGHKYVACNDIAVDPRDTSHVMVGSRDGLYEFRSGTFVKYHNNSNSLIKKMEDGTGTSYNLVLGVTYSNTGNLYLLNSYCSNGLLELPAGHTGMVHRRAKSIDRWEPEVRFLIKPYVDSRGLLWFVNTQWSDVTFYCYNPADNSVTEYKPHKNQDNTKIYTEMKFLRDITEDREGNIWIAGTDGIAYLPAEEIDYTTDMVYQYKVNRNDGTGLADYLLSKVDASAILFDSANRMYVGTKGAGVYIISSDRETEVSHFTADNSGLTSDIINGIALNEETGELYISTDRGLCSVTTEAMPIPDTLEKDNVKVYPNPVTPEYSGPITIEGLTLGADIKITTATGAVVHRGRSVSGIYQWNGCDFEGNRCASGVYNILLSTSDGEEGCVAKVAMVK